MYETTLIQIPVYDSFNCLLGCEEGGIILLYKTLVKNVFLRAREGGVQTKGHRSRVRSEYEDLDEECFNSWPSKSSSINI